MNIVRPLIYTWRYHLQLILTEKGSDVEVIFSSAAGERSVP